jgi:hypothetical protein
LTAEEYARRVRQLSNKDPRGLLLVLSYPLNEQFRAYLGAKFIRSFENEQASFIQNEPAVGENYWLYILKPPSNYPGQ